MHAQSIHMLLVRRRLFERVHLLLLVVVVVEDEPEDDTRESSDDADARVHPHDGRVAGGRDEGLADGRADGRGEEVEGLDEGLHVRRGFGVGVFETGDY
jgi:hypothetical protein